MKSRHHQRRPRVAAPGQVRIIAGHLRGSRLPVPEAAGLRPTSDRVRETLFNWLQPMIAGARVLDLYAGTGALGIEACSRGARSVLLVERSPALAQSLQAQVQRLKLDAVQVRCVDATAYLRAPGGPYDLVFLDPPFGDGVWQGVAADLEASGALAPGAWIYVEAPSAASLAMPANWQLHREGHAGAVRYTLFHRRPPSGLAPPGPAPVP